MRLLTLLLLSTSSFAVEKSENTKLSEALGHLIGESFEEMGLAIDIEALVQGLKDKAEGKNSPLNPMQYQEKLVALQAKKGNEQACQFLEKNIALPEVKEVVEGKLQYKIEKEGSGDKVESYHCPLVRIIGRFLDETIDSVEERTLDLNDLVPSFKNAIIGMKTGETRVFYVHPELQPDATKLLIMQVEILKVDGIPANDLILQNETHPL